MRTRARRRRRRTSRGARRASRLLRAALLELLPAPARTGVVPSELAAGALERLRRLRALLAAAAGGEAVGETGARVVENGVEGPGVGVGLLLEEVVEQGAHDLGGACARRRLRVEPTRQDL